MEVVSSVVTAAQSYQLVSLSDARFELNMKPTDTTDDGFLKMAITQASQMISSFCGIPFVVETVQDTIYFDRQDRGASWAFLSRRPVITVTSVTSGGDPLDSGDYVVDKAAGKIRLCRGYQSGDGFGLAWGDPPYYGHCPVVIQYDAGYSTIPGDVAAAALRLVTQRYKQRGRDPMLVAQSSPNVGEQRFWVGTTSGSEGGMPPEVVGMLSPYRRVGIS